MFNNVALDVAIGIVLVYLLYSLLVTILGEMVATWVGLRASILRVGIERMLNDAKPAKNQILVSLSKIPRVFGKNKKILKNSLAYRFYEYPSIKYLSKVDKGQAVFGKTKPSYISPDNFATTIINILSDNGTGGNKLDQIAFCLKFNTLQIQPDTLKHLRNLYNLSSNNLDNFKANIIAWYNETQDRVNGWYKRKIQRILFWLGFLIAVSFNVDSIKIAKILSNDKDARNQLVTMGVALSKDTGRYSGYLHAGKDSVHKQSVVDSGFSHVSKDITRANMILGLGWKFDSLKLETLDIKDTSEFETYQKYQKAIVRLTNSVKTITPHVNTLKNEILKLKTESDLIIQDTVAKRRKLNLAPLENNSIVLKSLSSERINLGIYNNRIKKANAAFKPVSDSLNNFNAQINIIRNAINSKNDKKYVSIKSVEFIKAKKIVRVSGYRRASGVDDFEYILGTLFSLSFLGFFITGLALSLGAPFWFGVLNKLVSLRGSGVKPEEKKPDPTSQVPTINPDNPTQPAIALLDTDPLSTSVEELVNRYGNNAGIISIGPGFIKQDGVKIRAIEIQAANQSTLGNIKNDIQNTYNNVPVRYMINTQIVAQLAAGEQIRNHSFKNSWGTLGCLAKNTDNPGKRYLMSCWHVLEEKDDMVENISQQIAKVCDGGITATMDVGFAEITIGGPLDNAAIGITRVYRPVTPDDAQNETPVKFKGAVSGFQQNIVVYDNAPDPQDIFDPDTGNTYHLSDLFSLTRYDSSNNTTSPSKRGDSGSVIVDLNGAPLGIVVGGDSNYTYAVKLSNVFADTVYSKYYIPYQIDNPINLNA